MKEIEFTPDAAKALRKMPANTARLIRAKIDEFAREPDSLANNVKALKGEFAGIVRLRVGDLRVFMDDMGTALLILRIAPRGSAYE